MSQMYIFAAPLPPNMYFFARRAGAQTRSDSHRGAGENPLRD
jgi:hypothetical protein